MTNKEQLEYYLFTPTINLATGSRQLSTNLTICKLYSCEQDSAYNGFSIGAQLEKRKPYYWAWLRRNSLPNNAENRNQYDTEHKDYWILRVLDDGYALLNRDNYWYCTSNIRRCLDELLVKYYSLVREWNSNNGEYCSGMRLYKRNRNRYTQFGDTRETSSLGEHFLNKYEVVNA